MPSPLTDINARSRYWRIALLAIVVSLAGCSTMELVYNRLGWLARWEAGRYVDMTTAQKALFNEQFGRFWRWHRQHELPRWTAEARRLAADATAPLGHDQLQAVASRYIEVWDRMSERLAPIACALGPTLDDEQVRDLLSGIDDDIEEYRSEQIDADPQTLRREAERDLEKGLRRWIGRLDAGQKQMIADWNAQRTSIAVPWLAYRRSWREAVAELLARRRQPGFCTHVTSLLTQGLQLWTEEQKAAFAANRLQWIDLFEQLLASLDDRQRRHLQRSLSELADSFEALSEQAAGDLRDGGDPARNEIQELPRRSAGVTAESSVIRRIIG